MVEARLLFPVLIHQSCRSARTKGREARSLIGSLRRFGFSTQRAPPQQMDYRLRLVCHLVETHDEASPRIVSQRYTGITHFWTVRES